MKINQLCILFSLIAVVIFSSCEPNNPYDRGPAYDEAGNLAKDSLLIVDYLETAEIDSLYRIYDPSGVVIIVQEEGTGSRPIRGNKIHSNYVGSLMSDGSVFDTNIESVAIENDLHEEGDTYNPLSFALEIDNVLTGWHIGFRRLRSGSRAKLIIPSTWGYRNDDTKENIPANSILVFDVEFLGMD